MDLCKHCGKWMPKSTGKREKEFCNNTCRSNYWYAKNKKKVFQKEQANEKAHYAPKLDDKIIHDESLSFDRLRQEAAPTKPPKTINQYMAWKREIDTPEEYKEFCEEVENNPLLSRKQKDFCKTANPSML